MKTIAQIAVFAALGLSAPVIAQPTSITVSFADLNLASAAGKAALVRRIDGAVRMVCGTPDSRDLTAAAASRACAVKARAAALPQVAVAVERAGNTMRIASAR